MDFPVTSAQQPPPFPWRTAALVAAVVATAELVVLLVVAGGSLLSGADTRTEGRSVEARQGRDREARVGRPRRPPRQTSRAAGSRSSCSTATAARAPPRATSSRIEGRGYRISVVGNAPSHDYPSSLVMYRPGFAAEGKRLARDLGIRLVSPLDGMRPGQLHGAHTVVILGA